MKIPDAYINGGLGQKVVQPAGMLAPPDRSVENSILNSVAQAGQGLAQIGAKENEYQGTLELQQAKEQQEELKKAEKEREDAYAKNEFLKFQPQLAQVQNQIVADPDIEPSDYQDKFREAAGKLASDNLYTKLNEHQMNAVVPLITSHINDGADQINKVAVKQVQDDTWAEAQTTLDSLKADPTRTTDQKLQLIYDANLFTGSGKTPAEIQEIQRKAAQEVMNDAADHRFNGTRQDLKSLLQFEKDITTKTADGDYTYLPGWDNGKREETVRMVQNKRQQLVLEAERQRREDLAAAKQEAANLVLEYKDKVKTGWIPTTADDYRFVSQVRRAASLSPSLSRQYNEATAYTTDFNHRMELKKKDPLGVAAAERGVILPNLNLLNPATLPQQIADRLLVSKKLGVNAVFKGDELNGLSEYLQTLPAAGQVQLLGQLSKTLGPVMSSATWNAAAEQVRQAHPDQAVMFKLFGDGKPAEAKLYADGRAYLTGEKKDLLKDKLTNFQRDASDGIDKILGTALAGMPKTRNTVKDAIATVYLAEAQRRNLPLDSLNKDLLSDVTQRVAGQTARTGSSFFGSGKTTIIPNGMSPDQFTNSIKAITPQDIANRGGVRGMSNQEAATYIKDRAWHESNNGYVFTKDGAVLYGNNGRPFTFGFDRGVGAK